MSSSQLAEQLKKHYQKIELTDKPRNYNYKHSKKTKNYSLEFERDPYSQQQNLLYKRAMFGLNIYTREEVQKMHWQKRKRIKKVQIRTQKELNLWKQELVNNLTNKLLSTMFPKSPVTKALLDYSYTDSEFKNTISFTDLGIKKSDIVKRLITKGLLPNNFNSLNIDSVLKK
jgi:hypothetical protein